MPKRRIKKLPSRGYCKLCRKDLYPDSISAQLALEFLSQNPPRGSDPPIRIYPCPGSQPTRRRFHLTSQPQRTEYREIRESA